MTTFDLELEQDGGTIILHEIEPHSHTPNASRNRHSIPFTTIQSCYEDILKVVVSPMMMFHASFERTMKKLPRSALRRIMTVLWFVDYARETSRFGSSDMGEAKRIDPKEERKLIIVRDLHFVNAFLIIFEMPGAFHPKRIVFRFFCASTFVQSVIFEGLLETLRLCFFSKDLRRRSRFLARYSARLFAFKIRRSIS